MKEVGKMSGFRDAVTDGVRTRMAQAPAVAVAAIDQIDHRTSGCSLCFGCPIYWNLHP
ncbi:MAG: hypothetical protein U9N36_08005 [Euryarchaeota archaeon]|nr:hypothetical protein [Euryarchaeota archaeon]